MTHIEKQPCLINLYERQEIIQHFRDLLNIGPMLDMDLNIEMSNFKKKLIKFGYDTETVHHMVQLSCFGTIYESEIPHPIKNMGDFWEWMRLKSRSKQR